MKKPPFSVTLVVVLLALTLPFVLAAFIGGREHVFIGFLLNPADGASYLAKMYQGWSGSWRFTLPFTAEPGEGAYLFLFYLFLGHLSRWLGLPLIITFHLARLAGAILFMFALGRFYDLFFTGSPDLYRIACWLTVVGSGMGWLILAAGLMPTDFWVAEAYPFLSMYSNPHFSTGLALILFSFTLLVDRSARFREGKLLLTGLLISVILPFGTVVVLLVGILHVAWTWLETRRLEWLPILCLGMLGGLFLLYQFWVAQVDPVLAVWNQQNQTPSPPIWDFLLSFSPALILAFFGVYRLSKDHGNPAHRIIMIWLVLGILLVYFPFALQRRFMLGFYIPAAALAVLGIDYLRQKYGRRVRMLLPAVFALSLPSNILIIFVGLVGVLGHSTMLFMSQDEARALEWIRDETPTRSLVLASPDLSRLIPGFTGRRVIYGHPFETAYAVQEEQRVKEFYGKVGKVTTSDPLLFDRKVDYVIYGPRERLFSGEIDFSALYLVFETGETRIYAVRGAP
jgi:hypothetical protein